MQAGWNNQTSNKKLYIQNCSHYYVLMDYAAVNYQH
jgi:hypothetical protein